MGLKKIISPFLKQGTIDKVDYLIGTLGTKDFILQASKGEGFDKLAMVLAHYLQETGSGKGRASVMLWLEVEEYKALSDQERKIRGPIIYNTFFFKNNGYNLLPESFLVPLKTRFDCNIFGKDLFMEAQRYVYSQIEKVFFPEYIQSKFYRSALLVNADEEDVGDIEEIDEEDENASWFLGSISRGQAEEKLKACKVNSFLFRTSSVQNCFALSMITFPESTIVHYVVQPAVDGGYILQDCPEDSKHYASLTAFVNESPILKNYVSAGARKLTIQELKTTEFMDLKQVLNDPTALCSFRNFMTVELSLENLECWEALCEFETTPSRVLANQIFKQYLDDSATMQVNVDGDMVVPLHKLMQEGDPLPSTMFQEIKNYLFELMKTSTFPRFENSLRMIKSIQ